MTEQFYFLAFISLCNCAVLILMEKWELIEWVQYHVPEWLFPSRCNFCLFHRLAFIEVLTMELLHSSRLEWSDLVDVALWPLAAAVLSLFWMRR